MSTVFIMLGFVIHEEQIYNFKAR